MNGRGAPILCVGLLLVACTGEPESAKSNATSSSQPSSSQPVAEPKAEGEQAEPQPEPEQGKPEPIAELEEPQPTTAAEPPTPPEPEVAPPPGTPVEVAINPWSASSFTAQWTLAAEPSEALALVLELDAGVLGRAGSSWYQIGADGQLVVAEMDMEPELPVLGVWPSDAWFVQSKMVEEDGEEEDIEILYIRLMKLRGGNRWVPQAYHGDQWFHPGTDDWNEAHMSTRSGMLIYPASLSQITRVAGKYDDPDIGPHRGTAIDFIEAGSGKIYLISHDSDGYYAQVECADDLCVADKASKLPLDDWKFGRKASRGKHSVSVLATSGAREFILHHRGKSDGWLLDELPPGDKPQGMWASEEGGLWTLTGDKLRWRDTESAWRDVALPPGMTGPSVALSEDRKQVFVSGLVGGAAKVFSAPANAVTATP